MEKMKIYPKHFKALGIEAAGAEHDQNEKSDPKGLTAV